MRLGTRLDSAVFQLTPTRTRYDLVISSDEKIEKIASGLVEPFLTHLKAVRDQVAEGGYSVALEPKLGDDAPWFTKGTVQRFVGFVNNPEILERAYAIEYEIVQIDEAIANHKDINPDLKTCEAKQEKLSYSTGGTKSISAISEEMSIVVYKPGMQSPPERSKSNDGNSKALLLNVLETRKVALQNEQGMAFARAVAAGFDLDHIPLLISFAECFGALRFRNGCDKFMDLWNKKHENGQWLDIEEDETVSSTSGVVKGPPQSYVDNNSENHENKALPVGQEVPWNQVYMQHSQFPHPVFPWPVRPSPDGTPHFNLYPMQPVAYYPNCSEKSNPSFFPIYPHPETVIPHKIRAHRRRSMDCVNGNTKEEDWGERDSEMSRDDLELDRLRSVRRGNHKRSNSSSKKNISSVSIPNVKYSMSRDYSTSATDSEAGSDDGEDILVRSSRVHNHIHSAPSRKRVVSASFDSLHQPASKQETGGNLWQEFQNCLLMDSDEYRSDPSPVHNDEVERARLKGRSECDYGDSVFTPDDVNRFDFDQRMFPLKENSDGRRVFQQGVEVDALILPCHESDDMISSDLPPMEVVLGGRLLPEISDQSFLVQLRLDGARSEDDDVRGREITSLVEKEERLKNHESEDLDFMMLDRREEMGPVCHDPTLDFVLPRNEGSGSLFNVNGKLEKLSASRGLENKITTRTATKGKMSKIGPRDEARARAEKMRIYKAGLQKIRREKEEEEVRRLEAMKAERQKRIAARNSPIPTLPSRPTTTRQLAVSHSPTSKFRDTEPRNTSTPRRQKATPPSPRPRLSRSASPVPKQEVSSARIRRLSEPKMLTSCLSGPKTANMNSILKMKPPPSMSGDKKTHPATEKTIFPISEPKTANRNSVSKMKPPSNKSGGKKAHEAIEKTILPLTKEGSMSCIVQETVEKNTPEPGYNHKNDSPVVEKTIRMVDFEKVASVNEVGDDITPQSELPVFGGDGGHISKESYEATHVRVASLLEDVGTSNEVMGVSERESNVLHEPDHKVETTGEAMKRDRANGRAPRGFKRLLLFGKKKQTFSSDDHFGESDTRDITGDGYKVKSLLCEEETSVVSKSSKKFIFSAAPSSFSLLSPFKSKSSEKRALLSAVAT